jgi:hypothetical protein
MAWVVSSHTSGSTLVSTNNARAADGLFPIPHLGSISFKTPSTLIARAAGLKSTQCRAPANQRQPEALWLRSTTRGSLRRPSLLTASGTTPHLFSEPELYEIQTAHLQPCHEPQRNPSNPKQSEARHN